ncbi:MAG TPA: hypothetical protein PLD23_03525 [Armatimonadota bacterium]|nr:hypothetical protein [Armatimonadota bacterium]HQK92545.1 hypothetical protein [Armatimonadota bacterium]
MMLVKLTEMDDGTVKAETARAVLGFFEDMTVSDVAAFLVKRAEDVGETIRFVDKLDEPTEHIDFQRLMKRKF